METTLPDDSATAVTLDKLPFSDLYIRMDKKAPSRYRIGANRERLSGNFEVPKEFDDQIDMVRTHLANTGEDSGTIDLDLMRLRFCAANVANDEKWAAIRRIPLIVPKIDKLLLDPGAVGLMRSWSRRRGIIVIGGATGAGKSTTAAALLQDFLESQGGTGLTIEDPPEYLLQGQIGENAACFQIEIKTESDWEAAGKTAMRWRPRFILVGEIRSPESAALALSASTSGHLVIATIHGGSVEETLVSLLNHADKKFGSAARSLLAENLVAAIHQRMGQYGPDLSVLESFTKGKLNEVVGRNIRDGRMQQLADHALPFFAQRTKKR